MKDAVLIPGYTQSFNDENYRKVEELYSEHGFDTHPVNLEWSSDFWENVESCRNRIEIPSDEVNHVFGHSWGAVVALVLSPELQPGSVTLASMSPEFKEDQSFYSLRGSVVNRFVGKVLALKMDIPDPVDPRPSYSEVLDGFDGDTEHLYGEREYEGWYGIESLGMGKEMIGNRAEILGSEPRIVEGATHYMNSESYRNLIRDVLEE